MSYLTRFFLPLTVIFSTLCCCGKDNGGGGSQEPEKTAPTAITVSPASLTDPAEGGSHDVTITAPARPKVEIPSAAKGWISVKDGTFKDYKLVVTFTVAANDSYSAREADVTISATVPIK